MKWFTTIIRVLPVVLRAIFGAEKMFNSSEEKHEQAVNVTLEQVKVNGTAPELKINLTEDGLYCLLDFLIPHLIKMLNTIFGKNWREDDLLKAVVEKLEIAFMHDENLEGEKGNESQNQFPG